MTPKGDDVHLRTEGLVWQEIDDELVLLDLESSTYLSANATGSVLLRLLAADRTKDDLVAALVAEYDITADRATADVDTYLATLAAKGLLA